MKKNCETAKTLFVVISYNSCSLMMQNLESIRRTGSPGSYKVVVVDNASTDGVTDYLSSQEDIIFISNKTNIGFGPACNQGVAATIGTEYEDYDVFLLNNDTVMTSKALPVMKRALYSAPDIGAVGAVSNYAGNRQDIDVSFDTVEEYVKFGENLNISPEDAYTECVRLNGFAMLIRRDVWNMVGGLDDDFAPGYYEDDAISIEILKRGYRLLIANEAFIYHVGSASFVKVNKSSLPLEHHKLFIQKYNFDILKYVYSSTALLSQVPFERKQSFTALQIPCGLGADIKALGSLYPNASFCAVESDEVLYNIVSKTETVFQSIEKTAANLTPGSIDLLIIDDEYLKKLNEEGKKVLLSLCSADCKSIVHYPSFDNYPLHDISLIVWDKETASDSLLESLSRYGFINCFYDDAVFPAIKSAQFRPEHVLFISEDSEKKRLFREHFPGVNTVSAAFIPYIIAHCLRLRITDPLCKGSGDFKLLSEKAKDCTALSHRNCLEKLDAIKAFTKEKEVRISTDLEISANTIFRLVTNDWNECTYITACCGENDLGIIGFNVKSLRTGDTLFSAISWKAFLLGIEDLSDTENIASAEDAPICRQNAIRILLKAHPDLYPIEKYLIGGHITSEYDSDNEKLPSKLFSASYNVVIYSLVQNDYDAWEKDSDAMLNSLFGTLDSLAFGIPGDPVVILLLGAENPVFEEESYDSKLAELHSEINPIICDFINDHPKIKTIKISDYIKDKSDFDGSVNTYATGVYSDVVTGIVSIINEALC